MKKILMIVTMFVVAFASYANAATEINTGDGTKVLVDGNNVSIKTKPTIAPAKAEVPTTVKKKKKGAVIKKKVKPTAVPTQVVAAPVSPAASAASIDITVIGNDGVSKTASANFGSVSPTASEVITTKKVWNAKTKKYDEVPVKAGEKSQASTSNKSNFRLNVNLGIFSPDKLTSTPHADHLTIAYGIRAFSSTNSANQPVGFQTQSSDTNTVIGDLAVKAKVWRLGLEYRPLEQRSTLDTKFYGSSLGALDVITSNVIIGKFYAVDERKWSAFLGLGTEYTRIEGSIRMGGFKFRTDGDGWTPVLQLGASYHLNRYWSVEALYEKSNVVVTTKIPGAPDLRTTRDDRVIARIDLGLF